MKPLLKAPETKRLKPKYDELLSNLALKINLRHYTLEMHIVHATDEGRARGSHSSTFRLVVSTFIERAE